MRGAGSIVPSRWERPRTCAAFDLREPNRSGCETLVNLLKNISSQFLNAFLIWPQLMAWQIVC